jgi:hypothetical protein
MTAEANITSSRPGADRASALASAASLGEGLIAVPRATGPAQGFVDHCTRHQIVLAQQRGLDGALQELSLWIVEVLDGHPAWDSSRTSRQPTVVPGLS